MDSVKTALENTRKDLLDLGLRNPLINYRTLKSKGVEIVNGRFETIFQLLVEQNKPLSFSAKLEDSFNNGMKDDLFSQLAIVDSEDSVPNEKKLKTLYSPAQLQKRLLNTYYSARTFIEEQGVNILYITLGMLKWYEAPSSEQLLQSPLILIPVELTRTSVRSGFRVCYTGEEIGFNLSLESKLKLEFGINFPDWPEIEELNLSTYIQEIERQINQQSRWSIDCDFICLGFFSFGKFLMYRDLDIAIWPDEASPSSHPVLCSLLQDGFREPNPLMDSNELLRK